MIVLALDCPHSHLTLVTLASKIMPIEIYHHIRSCSWYSLAIHLDGLLEVFAPHELVALDLHLLCLLTVLLGRRARLPQRLSPRRLRKDLL